MARNTMEITCEEIGDCSADALKGIECVFHTKAAFMTQTLKYRAEGDNAFLLLLKESGVLDEEIEKMKRLRPVNGTIQCSYGVKELEELYDRTIGRKTRKKGKKMSLFTLAALKPIECNNQLFSMDTMGYLVYGVLGNERCCDAFETYAEDKTAELYKEYRESEYFGQPILHMFLQEKKKTAALLIGLLCKARKDEQHEGYYNDLMKIIYTGYRKFKNQLKRFHKVPGENLMDILAGEGNILFIGAEVIIYLLIANDLNLKIIPDYDFYKSIYYINVCGSYFSYWQDISISKEGMEFQKKIVKEGYDLYSYYNNYYGVYLDEESEEAKTRRKKWEEEPVENLENVKVLCDPNQRNIDEKIFEQYGLNLRAFDEFKLKKDEAEQLCEIIKDTDMEDFETYLLIATLCKYIKELQNLCTQQSDEEREYQLSKAWANVEKADREQKSLEAERDYLQDKQLKTVETLSEAEKQNEKLKKLLKRQEEQREQEKAELIALRNYVYQEENEYIEETENALQEKNEILKDAKVIIVGGHSNWQGKIKTILTNAVCIMADNPNFTAELVKNAEYIIINTSVLKHACYYRVMSLKNADAHILYVNSNNIGRCIQKIREQMG